jgi:hypothetical protein
MVGGWSMWIWSFVRMAINYRKNFPIDMFVTLWLATLLVAICCTLMYVAACCHRCLQRKTIERLVFIGLLCAVVSGILAITSWVLAKDQQITVSSTSSPTDSFDVLLHNILLSTTTLDTCILFIALLLLFCTLCRRNPVALTV